MQQNNESNGRIAVVDDEVEIGDIIRRALSGDYEVDIYGSAAEVFEVLETGRRYDVILCDLFMPEVSGRQLYDTLAERWPHQADRVAFISGVATEDARQEELAGLEVPMLKKPFQLDALRETVEQVDPTSRQQ